MTMRKAIDTFMPKLVQTAKVIEADLSNRLG
jgi:hypothetical protein